MNEKLNFPSSGSDGNARLFYPLEGSYFSRP